MKVLKKLSKESGIPQKTLYHWWHEQESLKNETNGANDTTTRNEIENNNKNSSGNSDRPICKKCGENPIYLDNKSCKPLRQGRIFGPGSGAGPSRRIIKHGFSQLGPWCYDNSDERSTSPLIFSDFVGNSAGKCF